MNKITYATGNYGKYISVKNHFDNKKIDISFYNYDCIEPDVNDIEYISKCKVKEVYKILKSPCFVTDTGFFIEEYPNNPGYPGAFVKRSGISNDIDNLLKTMENVKNRKCKFVDCLTFYDGKEFYTFYGVCEGTLAKEKRGENIKSAKSNLWYVFIPNNHTKTLAEMTEYERNNRNDNSTSATNIFINWYMDEYKKENI